MVIGYLSGRCSPSSRMSRIKSRYWYSSCEASWRGALCVGASWGLSWTSGPLAGPSSVVAEGDILCMWNMCMCIVRGKERDERAQQLGKDGRRATRKLKAGRMNSRFFDRSPCTNDGIAHVKVISTLDSVVFNIFQHLV